MKIVQLTEQEAKAQEEKGFEDFHTAYKINQNLVRINPYSLFDPRRIGWNEAEKQLYQELEMWKTPKYSA